MGKVVRERGEGPERIKQPFLVHSVPPVRHPGTDPTGHVDMLLRASMLLHGFARDGTQLVESDAKWGAGLNHKYTTA